MNLLTTRPAEAERVSLESTRVSHVRKTWLMQGIFGFTWICFEPRLLVCLSWPRNIADSTSRAAYFLTAALAPTAWWPVPWATERACTNHIPFRPMHSLLLIRNLLDRSVLLAVQRGPEEHLQKAQCPRFFWGLAHCKSILRACLHHARSTRSTSSYTDRLLSKDQARTKDTYLLRFFDDTLTEAVPLCLY